MTTFNPSISNGTCYYAENTETKGDFVPCGNSAIQAWPCCKLGGFCLSLGDANACWDAKSGNTYVAGCTDPSFGSPNCARKPPAFHEQEWVAINQACKDLNTDAQATNVTNWTGCKVDDDSTELIKLPLAACTPYCEPEHVIYAGSSSLAAFASLPTLRGSSIFWQNNFVPPPTPAPGYSPGTPTGVVGTALPTSPSNPHAPNPGPELSPAAKAGVGVGASVGGLLVIFAIASAVMLFFRRRREREDAEAEAAAAAIPGPGYDRYPPETATTWNFPASSPPGAAGQQGASPPPPPFTTGTYPYHYQQALRQDGEAYTGYKTELPADERFIPGHSPQPSGVSAVSAGSPPGPGSSSVTGTTGYGNTSTYDSR